MLIYPTSLPYHFLPSLPFPSPPPSSPSPLTQPHPKCICICIRIPHPTSTPTGPSPDIPRLCTPDQAPFQTVASNPSGASASRSAEALPPFYLASPRLSPPPFFPGIPEGDPMQCSWVVRLELQCIVKVVKYVCLKSLDLFWVICSDASKKTRVFFFSSYLQFAK